MSIDRGYGIATSAVIADSYDLDALIADTEAAKVAAQAAQAAAETAETNAETAQTNAETAETNAETAETNASTSATAAASSATAAASSATAASTSETNAATSATSASTSATNASTSETNASTSASNAASSATAAAASAAAAAASADSFDDVYLGAKASDPTVDNDGDALSAGDLYFNTTSNVMKYYTGSAWVNIAAETFTEVSQDTTPQLGGDLDLNGNSITGMVIGTDIQAYDADTLKADTADTLTASFRGTVTTDNDGSFDMNVTNNFKCTPSGNFTLTFTNITAGQSGFILLVNTGGHTVSAHANTKVDANLLATVSTAGTYLLSYFSDSTNVYLTNSAAYT